MTGAVHRTFDDLEALYQASYPARRARGSLALIVARTADGHQTPARARVTGADGLEGDRWNHGLLRDRAAQITLMNRQVAEWLAGTQPLHTPGDNFLVDIDLAVAVLPVGARVRVGTTLLEVSAKLHAGCKKFSARFGQEALRWVNWRDHRDRRLRGVNCRVLEDGVVALGDPVEIVST